MMRRLGLMAAALVLTILVDTALADGCCGCCCGCCLPNCPYQRASSTTTPCASDVVTCDSYNNNPNACNGTQFNFNASNVKPFPKCCVSSQLPPGQQGPPWAVMCNEPLSDCQQQTSCTFQNGMCSPNPSSAPWLQKTCPTTVSCP